MGNILICDLCGKSISEEEGIVACDPITNGRITIAPIEGDFHARCANKRDAKALRELADELDPRTRKKSAGASATKNLPCPEGFSGRKTAKKCAACDKAETCPAKKCE